MSDEQEEQLTNLKNLVLSFENEPRDLLKVPKEQIDYFGYACLSNSLMFKEPTIPEYDEKGITYYIQTHVFNTLDSLTKYIKSLKSDIDKLFAIFAWEAMNIRYDVEALMAGEERDKSIEVIFENRRAVEEGYSLFFIEMAKRVDIDRRRIVVKKYYSYTKNFGYDPLTVPESIEPDHCCIFVQIDYIQFLSEPSWAAGHLDSDNKFIFEYRPQLFLIPLVKTVCDRMPITNSLIPFPFSYSDFFRACRVSPVGKCLKTESNPFVQYESPDGYVSQIYSCLSPINFLQIQIYKQDEFNRDEFNEIQCDNFTSYEIFQESIPNHPERCRFRTNIAFQEPGFYKVELFVESPLEITYFVNVLSKSEMPVPLTYNPFNSSKFIPIKPSRVLTKVKHGVVLIQFAVALKKSDILWNIVKLKEDDGFDEDEGEVISRERGRLIKLKIPFDETRYEDQLCVTFPSNGRYSIQIFLPTDEGSFVAHARYYVDVAGAELNGEDDVFSPIDFLPAGREFAAVTAVDDMNNEVKITPNANFHFIDETQLEQKLQIDIPSSISRKPKIRLEFIDGDGSIVEKPLLYDVKGTVFFFKWTVPDREGEYKLSCWLNGAPSFAIPYVYRRGPRRDLMEEERQIFDLLQQKVVLDSHYQGEVEKMAAALIGEDTKKKKESSKCCLLI